MFKRTNAETKKGVANFIGGMALGTAIGGITALFASPKSGRENRELAKDKLNKMKNFVEDRKTTGEIKQIFGDVTDEGKRLYKEAQNKISVRLRKIGEENLDADDYQKLVEDVVKGLKTQSSKTAAKLDNLRERLVEDWQEHKTFH